MTAAATTRVNRNRGGTGAVFNLLHNGLSSGQPRQLPVMFNHFVLAASRWTDKTFNELLIKRSTFQQQQQREGMVGAPVLGRTLTHYGGLPGLPSSPENASHSLPLCNRLFF